MGFSKTQHQVLFPIILLTSSKAIWASVKLSTSLGSRSSSSSSCLLPPPTSWSLGNSMTEKLFVYRYIRIDDILSALLSPIFVGGINLFFMSAYEPKSTSAFSSCPQLHFRKRFTTGECVTCCQVATVKSTICKQMIRVWHTFLFSKYIDLGTRCFLYSGLEHLRTLKSTRCIVHVEVVGGW